MKLLQFIALALLLTSCAPTAPTRTGLTVEQATTLAQKLANEKAATLYNSRPFGKGRPARFEAGRWVWTDQRGFGHSDIRATVKLAQDGSTSKVDLDLLDNQMRPQTMEFQEPIQVKPPQP